MKEMPKIVWLLDSPFASLHVVSKYFIAKYAQEKVDALVSTAGSEVMTGYFNPETGRSQRRFLPKFLFRNSRKSLMRKPLFTKSFKQRLLGRIVTVVRKSTRMNSSHLVISYDFLFLTILNS